MVPLSGGPAEAYDVPGVAGLPVSSSSPDTYRWETFASGSRSPVPEYSWIHTSHTGSSAVAHANTRAE